MAKFTFEKRIIYQTVIEAETLAEAEVILEDIEIDDLELDCNSTDEGWEFIRLDKTVD